MQYLVPLIVFVVLALLVWLTMHVQQGRERSFVLLFRRRYEEWAVYLDANDCTYQDPDC